MLKPTLLNVCSSQLSNAVAGIMDALHIMIDKAHIVGHDWGSSLAWAFAALYPDHSLQLVAMSAGNPNGHFTGAHANEQTQKSWHFSLHGIAEWALASGKLLAEGAAYKEAAEARSQAVMRRLKVMKAVQGDDLSAVIHFQTQHTIEDSLSTESSTCESDTVLRSAHLEQDEAIRQDNRQKAQQQKAITGISRQVSGSNGQASPIVAELQRESDEANRQVSQ
ncbi:TPA: hypothetical protein ACH3X3_002636 [Trebouxia sp. C0006]